MRKHLTNAAFGALDYASYPIGMLLVAPVVLHRLGASEYGLWMIATAVISAGGIIASGFCDANIQRIAALRAANDPVRIAETVRSMVGINLALGVAIAASAWIAAPSLAPHIAVSHVTPSRECLIALRIASVSILLRTMETVGISTLRGFEQYRRTVQISAAARLLTLGAAAILALMGHGIISILIVTALCLAIGAWMQFLEVHRFLGPVSLWPKFQVRETRILLGLGVFVWLQALGGVIFGQTDRILLGVSLGALAVAPYSLCVQFAQPIFGLAASGLHFLFPYLSGRAGTLSNRGLRRTLFRAFSCNLLLVLCGAVMLLVAGPRLIRIWAGAEVAHRAAGILPPIVAGSALMGLGVTGTYAMQALGRFGTVAGISLAGRTLMLLLMVILLHHSGLAGLAFSRLGYGVLALIVYIPLLAHLRRPPAIPQTATLPIRYQVQEGPKL